MWLQWPESGHCWAIEKILRQFSRKVPYKIHHGNIRRMRQHDRNGFAWRWDHGRCIHLNREAHGASLTAVGVSGCMELDPGPAPGHGLPPGEVLAAATLSWDKPAAVPHIPNTHGA